MHASSAPKADRRTFLKQSWSWLRFAILAAFLYPLLEFLGYRVPRKPREVKVHKVVKEGGFYLDQEFILFQGATGAWAVSRTCTHLGCRVNYQEKEQLIVCPCHQSRFTSKGVRISGPAQKNLPTYPVAEMPEGEGKGYVVIL